MPQGEHRPYWQPLGSGPPVPPLTERRCRAIIARSVAAANEEERAASRKMEERYKQTFAMAGMKDLPDGRRIWIPPSGRPYWVGGANAGPDLTPEECERYGLAKREMLT